jgi:pilus assembly protein CpaE
MEAPMSEALRVLCLTADPAVAAQVTGALTRLPGFSVTTRVADYQTGIGELGDPDLAIILLGADPVLGLTVIEEVHRSAPSTQVLAISPEDNPETIVKAMRAGADEFLSLPVTPTALLKVCIKISELRRCTSPSSAPRGEVWVAYGAKGGVGVTTIVANLALALRAAGRNVACVDLDLYAGDLALFLNVTPLYTLRDIVSNYKRLDSVFLQGTMIRHPSGVALLAAPPPKEGEPPLVLSGEATLAVLELLDGMHEVTLVDTSGIPSESNRAALTCADRILLTTELTIPSLRGCLRTLGWLREEGVDTAATVEVVVNKHSTRSADIPLADVSRMLKLPIRTLVPRDDAAVCAAINNGQPLESVKGGSPVQQAIAGLVARGGPASDAAPRRKSFFGLFSGTKSVEAR